MSAVKDVHGLDLKRFDHISSLYRLKRAVAICLKFGRELKAKSVGQSNKSEGSSLYESIVMDDIREAETKVVQLVQRETFHEELGALQIANGYVKQDSALNRLDCFVDENGLELGDE